MALSRAAFWLALLIPASLLGGALISEHVFGLYPCEMCIWQRWPHGVALVLAGVALIFSRQSWASFLVLSAAVAVAVSGVIGGFHAGVEYGWWEGITSCATTVGNEGGDMLDSIMNAPLVRCDVAPWSLFGISLAGYNFLLSMGGAILILVLMAAGRRSNAHG